MATAGALGTRRALADLDAHALMLALAEAIPDLPPPPEPTPRDRSAPEECHAITAAERSAWIVRAIAHVAGVELDIPEPAPAPRPAPVVGYNIAERDAERLERWKRGEALTDPEAEPEPAGGPVATAEAPQAVEAAQEPQEARETAEAGEVAPEAGGRAPRGWRGPWPGA